MFDESKIRLSPKKKFKALVYLTFRIVIDVVEDILISLTNDEESAAKQKCVCPTTDSLTRAEVFQKLLRQNSSDRKSEMTLYQKLILPDFEIFHFQMNTFYPL